MEQLVLPRQFGILAIILYNCIILYCFQATRIAGWEGPVEQLVLPRQSGILAGLGLDNNVRYVV